MHSELIKRSCMFAAHRFYNRIYSRPDQMEEKAHHFKLAEILRKYRANLWQVE